jgi:metal-responsive CopG/Arc/MetJ family transcriptional regulator
MTKPELARIDNPAARIGVSRNKLIMDAIARELDRLEATEATEEARD